MDARAASVALQCRMPAALVEDVPPVGDALAEGAHEFVRGGVGVLAALEEGRYLLVVGPVVVPGEDAGGVKGGEAVVALLAGHLTQRATLLFFAADDAWKEESIV